ncbi:MAG: SDR family oxidoreductase [Candidatus Melainabacteria bacterium]|jgi:uncharacterized protein YbjT (DUF2867 family)|nr:SDR family oxidoreductase [Candidatus Melainabacteria bacterium]
MQIDDSRQADQRELVVVIGATGYVGARLVPRLIEAGFRVRACGRSLAKLESRTWSKMDGVELVSVDVFDKDSLSAALHGAQHAYYLVHSMNSTSKDFADSDRKAAHNMVQCASEQRIERIVFLGGLTGQPLEPASGKSKQDAPKLSKHLESRDEVAKILQAGPVPTTVLRAGIILGSGSTSFEILRYLVSRLPIMITPKWVSTPTQPIAIRNVLHYLIGCLKVPETVGRQFDIGGPDILSYGELMQIYAEEAGLGRRIIIPVPVFTPTLSSHWIHLVTPVPGYIARPLAEGLRNKSVCEPDSEAEIRALMPQDLFTCRMAIRLALEIMQHRIKDRKVESHWTDAGIMPPVEWANPGDPNWAGGDFYRDFREIVVEQSPAEVWSRLELLGGGTGWYYGNWLWRLRGWMDRVIGGVGLTRGRRDNQRLYAGDALDFWRIMEVKDEKRLVLSAEMILPGRATLEFRLKDLGQGRTRVQQIACYQPQGLLGLLYWWSVKPLHAFVFNGMLRGIAAGDDKKIISGPSFAQSI